MKGFVILLVSVLLFVSCESLGVGFSKAEVRPVFETKAQEFFSSVDEEDGITIMDAEVQHNALVPYDYTGLLMIDWESFREWTEDSELNDTAETIVDEPIDEGTPQQEVSGASAWDDITGNDIVLITCLVIFMICLFIIAYLSSLKRRD